MKNLTPELVAKARAAKSAEELLELAKENDVELTEAEAKTYFEQLHANTAVSDDELEAVVGGGIICEIFEALSHSSNSSNESNCPYCGGKNQTTNIPDKSSITPLPYDPLPCDPNDKNKIEFL